jgi:iron complex outermembrane receptor protein
VGAIARYRQYAQLNWAYGPWGATLANNYQDGYSEPCKDEDPSGCTVRRVGSYSVWDLQGRYSGLKNTTLTLGVRNALDKAPPLSNQTEFGRLQKGFDPSYADPRGRMFYAALSLAFD